MDKIKKGMSEGVGALDGLQNKNKSNIETVDTNQNINHNNNMNNDNPTNTLESRIKQIKSKASKRKIKNVTFGLYEDQQESIKELADALGLGVNQFMREAGDMIIDIFNNKLKG